ncbi:MAG: hypothetical protein HYX91_05905 [Chloroflexi bacterium]|nr:hypothetical protein [Chloroflexota bacterium]
MDKREVLIGRLVLAVISVLLEEAGLYAIWRWVLPEMDIFLPPYVIVIVMTAWAAYSVYAFKAGTKALGRSALPGLPGMIGSSGSVASPLEPEGLVKICGELWVAKSVGGEIEVGEQVVVVGQDSLKLLVRQAEPKH